MRNLENWVVCDCNVSMHPFFDFRGSYRFSGIHAISTIESTILRLTSLVFVFDLKCPMRMSSIMASTASFPSSPGLESVLGRMGP